MNRRSVLATGATVALGSIAGCLGSDEEYQTYSVGGQEVELAPTDDVYEWFEDDDASFVDARSRREYDHIHVEDAVFSPAPDGLAQDDPVETWSADTRIVTYCVCPHGLAGQRAASLQDDGYTDVYALEEGLKEWIEREYPVEGAAVERQLPAYDVRGQSDPAHAGENVWVQEPASGQRELSPVQSDGTYELTLHFVDVTPETVLELQAPDYELEATLSELMADVVTGPERNL